MSLCSFPQVKLYKSENLDNPIQTVSLGQSLFFHFPPLLRDGEVRPGRLLLSPPPGPQAAALGRQSSFSITSLQKIISTHRRFGKDQDIEHDLITSEVVQLIGLLTN